MSASTGSIALIAGWKATSINPIIGALRFFYGTTLRRKEMLSPTAVENELGQQSGGNRTASAL